MAEIVRELDPSEFPLAEKVWEEYRGQKADPKIERIFGVFDDGDLAAGEHQAPGWQRDGLRLLARCIPGKRVCPEGSASPARCLWVGTDLHPLDHRPDLVLQDLRLDPDTGSPAATVHKGPVQLLLRGDGRVQRLPDGERREEVIGKFSLIARKIR
jgi:hypothetical protein